MCPSRSAETLRGHINVPIVYKELKHSLHVVMHLVQCPEALNMWNASTNSQVLSQCNVLLVIVISILSFCGNTGNSYTVDSGY